MMPIGVYLYDMAFPVIALQVVVLRKVLQGVNIIAYRIQTHYDVFQRVEFETESVFYRTSFANVDAVDEVVVGECYEPEIVYHVDVDIFKKVEILGVEVAKFDFVVVLCCDGGADVVEFHISVRFIHLDIQYVRDFFYLMPY